VFGLGLELFVWAVEAWWERKGKGVEEESVCVRAGWQGLAVGMLESEALMMDETKRSKSIDLDAPCID
jgi:hypothetical protein